MEFGESDRERMIEMANRLRMVERRQGATHRRVKRLPTALVAALSKRALILIGIGIAIGSALGGVGIELVRAAVSSALHLPH